MRRSVASGMDEEEFGEQGVATTGVQKERREEENGMPYIFKRLECQTTPFALAWKSMLMPLGSAKRDVRRCASSRETGLIGRHLRRNPDSDNGRYEPWSS